ncbi:hypothetical protein [Streptomyces lasalocidi]|nr:hypothetical protein [Streptomyces lasalocidi]
MDRPSSAVGVREVGDPCDRRDEGVVLSIRAAAAVWKDDSRSGMFAR